MKNEDILEYHRSKRYRGSYYGGSNQRAISARIDHCVMRELDLECAASGQKRNGVINKAIRWYITALDDARRAQAQGGTGVDGTVSASHEQLLVASLTASELSKLRHIATALNVSVDELVERLLYKLLDEFDRKPMAYM